MLYLFALGKKKAEGGEGKSIWLFREVGVSTALSWEYHIGTMEGSRDNEG